MRTLHACLNDVERVHDERGHGAGAEAGGDLDDGGGDARMAFVGHCKMAGRDSAGYITGEERVPSDGRRARW